MPRWRQLMHYCWSTCNTMQFNSWCLDSLQGIQESRQEELLFVCTLYIKLLLTGNDCVNTVQLLLGVCLHYNLLYLQLPCSVSTVVTTELLGYVAFAVSSSAPGWCLICCTDGTVMLTSSLPWAGWSMLDSRLLETVIEVSKSCHNSWTKLQFKNVAN